jgi:hypothetical protein
MDKILLKLILRFCHRMSVLALYFDVCSPIRFNYLTVQLYKAIIMPLPEPAV